MWLCGYLAMWPCGYVAMWLCSYMAMWVCGYVAILSFVRIPRSWTPMHIPVSDSPARRCCIHIYQSELAWSQYFASVFRLSVFQSTSLPHCRYSWDAMDSRKNATLVAKRSPSRHNIVAISSESLTLACDGPRSMTSYPAVRIRSRSQQVVQQLALDLDPMM